MLIDLWCCCLDLVNIPLRATTYFLVLIGVLGSDHLIIRSVCALALNRWFPSFPLSDWLWTTLNLLCPSLPLVYSPSMRLWRGVFLLPLAHSVSVRGFSVLAGLFAPARPRVPCRCIIVTAFCSCLFASPFMTLSSLGNPPLDLFGVFSSEHDLIDR